MQYKYNISILPPKCEGYVHPFQIDGDANPLLHERIAINGPSPLLMGKA